MKLSARVSVTIVGLLIVLGALGLVKGLQIRQMIAHGEAFVPAPQTVTVAKVRPTAWETSISAIGSLQAVRGVTVTAELSGKVERIVFEAGTVAKAGQLLVQQDVSTETAQLQVARSEADLAFKNLERARNLRRQKVIPESQLDELIALHDQAIAQVKLIQSTIAKKTIRAPFTGHLGIRQVNLGEVLENGQPIVSLQTLNPIYVNFQLPQQNLTRIKQGLSIRVVSDVSTGQSAKGIISTVNPEVDSRSRNILIQATLPNNGEVLRPGMYVKVDVIMPSMEQVLTIPATAVHFAPYSDSVFLVEISEGGKNPKQLVLRQQFVKLGEQRGDIVIVREGLKSGQTIVSTGVFKLRNGQTVVVDNSLAPEFKKAPRPADA